MRAHAEVIGVLGLQPSDLHRPFAPEDVDLALIAAERVAVALIKEQSLRGEQSWRVRGEATSLLLDAARAIVKTCGSVCSGDVLIGG